MSQITIFGLWIRTGIVLNAIWLRAKIDVEVVCPTNTAVWVHFNYESINPVSGVLRGSSSGPEMRRD